MHVDPKNVIEAEQLAPANPDKELKSILKRSGITENVQPKEKKFRFAKWDKLAEFDPDTSFVFSRFLVMCLYICDSYANTQL